MESDGRGEEAADDILVMLAASERFFIESMRRRTVAAAASGSPLPRTAEMRACARYVGCSREGEADVQAVVYVAPGDGRPRWPQPS